MVRITWVANPDSDNVSTYHVQRSFVGVETQNTAPFNIQTTDILQVRVDGGDIVDVSFASVTNGAATAQQVETILQGSLYDYGGTAKQSSSNTKVILQSNRQNDRGSIQIVGGSAAAGLGLSVGEYKFQEDPVSIGTTSHPTVQFDDDDGDLGYQYRIIAENASSECSPPSDYFEPFRETIESAVVYGTIIGPDGKAVENALIEYGAPINKRPMDDTRSSYPFNKDARVGITNELEEVLTNEQGYFQVVVPADISLRLKIDTIGYDFVVKSPNIGEEKEFTKLDQDYDYESFGLDGDIFT